MTTSVDARAGVQAGRRTVEPLEADQVARPANVTQVRLPAVLVPQRDRALLDHEDVGLVRLALPRHELVGGEEPHAAEVGEGDQVRLGDRVER